MRYFDLSIQKSFKLGEGKRQLQFRVDLLNAFNHPNFRVGNGQNFTDLFSQPTGGLQPSICLVGGTLPSCGATYSANYMPSITVSDYNLWANAQSVNPGTVNSNTVKVGSKTYTYYNGPGVAAYQEINDMVNAQRTSGVLPNNFFAVQLPAGFNSANATSYDIRTLDGYKYYRLRNAYSTGFGTLYNPNGSSRYIQFGLKLLF